MDVADICDRLNECAAELARELLPNGHKSGAYWMASGIADTGRSASLAVHISGGSVGHWRDHGNAAPGEDHGDMLDLVMLTRTGGDKRAAVEWAKSYLGIQDDFRPGRPAELSAEEKARRVEEARQREAEREEAAAKQREEKAKNARWRFLQGTELAGTPAAAYLEGRGINPGAGWPRSLRYHPQLWFSPLEQKLPAMVAAIYDAAGTHIGTHRTYLHHWEGRGWGKVDHANAKMVLGSAWGGFIPINKGASGKSMRDMREGEPVYVTEGIEDALSVRMAKPEARIICAIFLGNVGAIVLPPAARELVLVADRDDNEKAQATLEKVIRQQQARGLTMRLVVPPPGMKDINDWLRSPASGRRSA
jgi:hypothetical protein